MDENKAFEEFVIARCCEVIKDDLQCKELIQDIIAISQELKAILAPEQYNVFLKYDRKIAAYQARLETVLYKQGAKDKCSMI